MVKKRAQQSELPRPEDEREADLAPVVRSRRERVVKTRLHSSDATASSHTDSGSGDHYSPVNVTENPRDASGDELNEPAKQGKDSRRSRNFKKGSTRTAPTRRKALDGPSKRGPGGIFKTAAIKVLTEAGTLLSSGVIYDRAMKQGLVSESAGKTPEATMAAALYTDIKKYRNQSTFIKPREGLFGLRDWTAEDCNILTPAERAEIASHQESDRDSAAQMSGATPEVSAQEAEDPAHDPKRSSKIKKERTQKRGRLPKPKGVQKPVLRRARSLTVPPSERVEGSKAAQPALSGPPAIFANERLQALFMAVDQVSGTTATSEMGSKADSATDSGGMPSPSHGYEDVPVTSVRASAEPEAESALVPTLPWVPKTEDGAEAASNSPFRDAGPSQAAMLQDTLDLEAHQHQMPSAFENFSPAGLPAPPGGFGYPPSLTTGESLSPLELQTALGQIQLLEQHLQALDHSNRFDPQVGNCHMQLSTLYLAIGHREKAVQNYLIALDRCEAMLA